ncbi:capsule biosynthesis repeating unit flippase Wzx [Streptococcus pneumoniae]|uniref:Flippase Wzx n=5 Tax=Streptococcus pneumoniae TaxID=1313 RepID=Q9R923_STREE|nr:oligosaccharide flippase family protein [Streptococcus pneumoniae]EGI88102.1 polysaccharide biosynthesis family protein [Streptococcus pneumoniae GA41301]EJG51859.1 flippase Wzx [Streptococcus pneumoniae 2070768]EOB26388.1 capsule biosynthesis repeating unit flippase Wzx [Streptococcus pneumoniae 357]EOB30278.1 capsule biosynthesis repeating unit flippase Wzx [Streptococcus pneumoniae 3051]EPR95902.1 transporter [Streptococcus pneumoniae 1779n23_04]OYL03277.1 transporter [Streptococcus pne
MSKYKELAKNTGIFALANFSSKILIFLLVPIYTRVLTTTEYGFYDLVYTTIQLFVPILTLNISEAVMRFLMKDGVSKKSVFSIAVLDIFIGSIAFALLLLVNNLFSLSDLISQYSIYIFVIFVFYTLNNFLIQFSKGIDKIGVTAISGVISTAVMLAMNVILLVVFDWGLLGFFIANVCGYVIPCIYIVSRLRLWELFEIKIDKKLQWEMVYYALPLVLNILSWWVNNTSDRYIVTAIVGIQASAIISVAYKIPQILSTISAIFIQSWQISAIKIQEDKSDTTFVSNMLLYYNALLLIIASGIILFVKPISNILFGISFYSAWELVPFLIISSLFNAISGCIGAIMGAKMDTHNIAKSALVGMIANIILNIVLTFLMGPQGITISTLIASFLIFYMRKDSVKEINSETYRAIYLSWILLVVEACLLIYMDFIIGALIAMVINLFLLKDVIKPLYLKIFKRN